MRSHLLNSFTFLIGLLGFKTSAAIASDIFLCDPGGEIVGESEDPRHSQCLDVLSWSWGATKELGLTGGTGRDDVIGDVGDLAFVKWIDKSTPILMQSATKGKVFPKVEIHNYKSCCDAEYLKITLEQALVTSYQTGGSAGDDRPTESVSLNFTKIQLCYTYLNTDGKPGSEPECYGWDVEGAASY